MIPDVTSSKHGGNTESVQANERAGNFKATLRTEIYSYLRMDRPRGATCAELAQHFNKPMHSLSGRVSELKAMKMVVASEERRADVHVQQQKTLF